MHFDLSEDQQLIRDTARDFSRNEIGPRAAGWDKEGAFPRDTFGAFAELCMLGVLAPEEHGGADAGPVAMSAVTEELARQDGGFAMVAAMHGAGIVEHLSTFGGEAVKGRSLPGLASGELLGTWVWPWRPGADLDGSGQNVGRCSAMGELTARRQADGWLLTGQVPMVPLGNQADLLLVVADNEAPDGGSSSSGATAFLLEKETPGLTRGESKPRLGMRSVDRADLSFDDVLLADSAVVGVPGKAEANAAAVLDSLRIQLAALAVGLGRAALDEAVAYAQQRRQFGKPIAAFQAIQWKLAEAAAGIDAAQLLVRKAAWLREDGRDSGDAARMALLFATGLAVQTAADGIQIHGGYGYVKELPMERLYRDAKTLQAWDGTAGTQRIELGAAISADQSILAEAGPT